MVPSMHWMPSIQAVRMDLEKSAQNRSADRHRERAEPTASTAASIAMPGQN